MPCTSARRGRWTGAESVGSASCPAPMARTGNKPTIRYAPRHEPEDGRGRGVSTMTDVPGLDVAGLTGWLAVAHPHLADEPLRASVIAGGRSNLTYSIDGARLPLIVRRPPLGHVLSSAHD